MSSPSQVRDNRPAREKTMDHVEKGLLWQQGLVTNFAEKVKRSITHLDTEINHLDQVRLKLEADLRDKVRFGESGFGWGSDFNSGINCG
jgi:hypothetical protein